QGNSIAVDASGNCYIGGYSFFQNYAYLQIFYAKYNSAGAVQWTKRDGGTSSISTNENGVRAIAVDNFGNSYMTGFDRTTTSSGSAFVRKCDPSGNLVWQKNRPEYSFGNDIVVDGVGNSYVTGAYVDVTNYSIFSTKYNAAGVVVWTQNGSGADADYGDGIALDAQGNCFVTGRFQHNTDFSTLNISNTSSGISDVFVAKYDNKGSVVWLQQAGESGQDAGSKIGVDAAGNCYINGYYSTNATFGTTTLNGVNFNPFLAKIGITAATTLGSAVVKGENFCGGAVVTVDFAITGKYDDANAFTAQLSNASGSFNSPLNIGTLESPLNTSIYAILPLTTPAGTGYRIRVVSSNPALIGNDNGIDIRINQTDCKNNVVKLATSPIAAVEYFIDTDPGVGKGIALNTAGGLSVSETFNIALPTLTAGFHNLFIRSKNADGIWGLYEGRVFYVQPVTLVLNSSPVVAAEYFFDTEPGVGSGTAVASFSSGNTISVTKPIATTGLSAGFHNLFVRTKDAKGKWGMYEGRVVYIQPAVASSVAEPIIAAEYFFNTDPGVGLGTAINTGAAVNELTLNIPSLATSPLQTGTHNVFIRVKNKAAKWGLAERRTFTICSNVLGSPAITGSSTICPGNTLQLTAGNVTGATSYKWTGPNNFTATGQSITINSVSATNAGVYTVVASNEATTCGDGNPTKITVIVGTTAAPTGLETQTFVSGTLTTIVLSGSGIKWYASASDASTRTNVLPNTTVLVNNTTYYATQTINGCESASSIAVKVTVTLSVNEFDANAFTYYPNPVSNELNLSYSYGLTSVKVTDVLGRQVYFKKLNEDSVKVDMTNLIRGVYFVEVTSKDSSKTIKVIKK
ncbi:T9SS type A sorting domain-containing protein, partial [Flavobacterium sp.]|uniref:T9SS type A sorting domain-containing protein n=1 Tax=Flavobacterium sp. TaxID=239 RepID=UPI00286E7AE6